MDNKTLKVPLDAFQNFLKDVNTRIKGNQQKGLLSSARCSIIDHLIEKGPQSLTSLSIYRNVKAATMSRLLDSLVNDGLILRANSRLDRRSKIFMVTKLGKQMVDDAHQNERVQLEKIMSKLPEQDQATVSQAIQVVHKILMQLN